MRVPSPGPNQSSGLTVALTFQGDLKDAALPSAGYSAVGRQDFDGELSRTASAAHTQDSLGVSGGVSLRPSMHNDGRSTVDPRAFSARGQ